MVLTMLGDPCSFLTLRHLICCFTLDLHYINDKVKTYIWAKPANASLVGDARTHAIWCHHSSVLTARRSDVRRPSLILPPLRCISASDDEHTYATVGALLGKQSVGMVERQLQTCRKLSIPSHRRRTFSAPCRHRTDFIVPN